ncbi:MAG: hypothetical protein HY552_04690 [Elusimicrobia bacterium]|nr:hypothetical protein [Elusimicrobiota bacterium]
MNDTFSPVGSSAAPPLGALVRAAWRTIADRAGTLLGVWATTGLPALVLTAAAVYASGLGDRDAVKAALDAGRYGAVIGFGAAGLLAALIRALAFAAVVAVAAEFHAQGGMATAAALEKAAERLPALIWTYAVVSLRILAAPVFLAPDLIATARRFPLAAGLTALLAAIPGILLVALRSGGLGAALLLTAVIVYFASAVSLSLRYSFARIAVVAEGLSGAAAARRSEETIAPNMGKFAGNMLAFALLYLLGRLAMGVVVATLLLIVRRSGLDAASYVLDVLVDGMSFFVTAWMTAATTLLFLGLAVSAPPAPAGPAAD